MSNSLFWLGGKKKPLKAPKKEKAEMDEVLSSLSVFTLLIFFLNSFSLGRYCVQKQAKRGAEEA
jgi:hypothetical protein